MSQIEDQRVKAYMSSCAYKYWCRYTQEWVSSGYRHGNVMPRLPSSSVAKNNTGLGSCGGDSWACWAMGENDKKMPEGFNFLASLRSIGWKTVLGHRGMSNPQP